MRRAFWEGSNIQCCQGGSSSICSRQQEGDSALCEIRVSEFLTVFTRLSLRCVRLPGLVYIAAGHVDRMWTEQQGAQEAQNASWSQPQITSHGRRAEYLVGRIFHHVISFKVPNT